MYRLLYVIGQYLYNNQIQKEYDFLKNTEFLGRKEIDSFQLKELKRILTLAYSKSTFYKDLYDKHNLKINEINSLEDLKGIPCIDKKQLVENSQQIQIEQSFVKIYPAKTSGSTGQSLKFKRNKSWDARNRASISLGYQWFNVKPWELNGYFWGYNFDTISVIKTRILDAMQNRFRLFSLKKSALDSFIKKLENASYLHGYSSMIYEVAKYTNSLKAKPILKLKLIKGTSEKILETYQREVWEAFNLKIISEYGAAESGIIAFECPHGSLHNFWQNVIIEEVDNEIIVTNLVSDSFPIIRYKLGDYVTIDSSTNCHCGRNGVIVKDIAGRVGEKILGHNHSYPSLTLYYVFKNLNQIGIQLNYTAVQRVKGELELSVEQKVDKKSRMKLLAEFEKYFNNDVIVYLKDSVRIKTESKKQKDFISLLEKEL